MAAVSSRLQGLLVGWPMLAPTEDPKTVPLHDGNLIQVTYVLLYVFFGADTWPRTSFQES